MDFVVTGGAGFIGSHLTDGLINAGHQVQVVDNLSTGSKSNINKDASFEYPIDCEQTPQNLLHSNTVVIHCAAQPRCNISLYMPEDDALKNYLAGLRFLIRCMNSKVKRFVLVSSMSVYGNTGKLPYTEDMHPNPGDPYGVHKQALEQIALIEGKANNVEVVIVRPQHVFGTRQIPDLTYRNVIARWIKRGILGYELPVFGSLKISRAFSPVSTIVRGIMEAAIKEGISGEIFNLGSSYVRSLEEISEEIRRLIQKPVSFKFLPSPPTLLETYYGSVDKAKLVLNVKEEKHEFHQNLENLFLEISKKMVDLDEKKLRPELLNEEFSQIYWNE